MTEYLSLLNINICYFNLCGVSKTYCNFRISTKKRITKNKDICFIEDHTSGC